MARLETWWRCPVCKAKAFTTRKEAEDCARTHVYAEHWAVSQKYPGKAVKVMRNRGVAQALKEAEEDDNIKTERKQNDEQIQQETLRLVQGTPYLPDLRTEGSSTKQGKMLHLPRKERQQEAEDDGCCKAERE